MSGSDPTYLGVVSAVSGATLTIRLAQSLDSGFAVIKGHTYRVGQVGSFVRIPQGYQDLFGIVSEVGATAAPAQADISNADSGRWMTVQLAGETVGGQFERGLRQKTFFFKLSYFICESNFMSFRQPTSDEI
ncbi:hypothetical protein [Stenotrophomonas maltophilia]|uniref:hypothetical protein n=1 Tax=Stenotrophomonas maltophilia TaxID=40324 RepID=UPI0031F2F7ED